MRRRNTKSLVIALIILTVFLGGAYAILTTVLNITGTATGAGDFKIEFTQATATDPNKATVTIGPDGTTLNINTNLTYPGDTVTTNFTIKNTGGLASTVDALTVNENSTADFTIDIAGLDTIEGTTLDVGETTQGSVVVTWNSASTNPTPPEVNFDVTINYSQTAR